jgi:hypothetical protein
MEIDRTEVARYVAEFGQQGATWYARGMSYEDAREKYTRETREYIERQRATAARLEQELAERDGK